MCKCEVTIDLRHDIATNTLLTSSVPWPLLHVMPIPNLHSKRTVHTNETFDFLKDIVAKVPDPVESDTGASGATAAVVAGDNRGGKRRKTAKNADESD